MKLPIFLLGVSLALVIPAHSQAAKGKVMRLDWADEFNHDGAPDPTIWRFETGFKRNREAQWYQPQNAWVENGHLVIQARRERVQNPDFDPKSTNWRDQRAYADYTSACLTTDGLKPLYYGRVEVRARVQGQMGLWPAIWTLGLEGLKSYNGEIDIMEWYRGKLLANAAWGGPDPQHPRWDKSVRPVASFGDPTWYDKFHVWSLDWDRDSLTISVDGLVLNTVDLSRTFNESQSRRNPFRGPHYLLLNLALGGTEGGDLAQTSFPARFEVDYVRVYRTLD